MSDNQAYYADDNNRRWTSRARGELERVPARRPSPGHRIDIALSAGSARGATKTNRTVQSESVYIRGRIAGYPEGSAFRYATRLFHPIAWLTRRMVNRSIADAGIGDHAGEPGTCTLNAAQNLARGRGCVGSK